MRRLGLAIWVLALVGILSLLFAPLEMLMPAGLDMNAMTFRAVALINPLILTSLAVLAGCLTAPKLGLDAPLLRAMLMREPAGPVLVRQLGPALIGGGVSALVVVAYGLLPADWFAASPAQAFEMPLASKLLYGGITEEVLMRWGVMSLIAWIIWRLSGRPRSSIVVGLVMAAALFALGHLPLLFALAPGAGPMMIAAVLAGNMLPGVICGALFWRYGLEAAMLAHALAHLLSTLLVLLHP